MPKKKISLFDLSQTFPKMEYEELYKEIIGKIEQGVYQPIKNSGLNGKKPALYNAYWFITPDQDYSKTLDELQYKINPDIDISYYLNHPHKYENDKVYVMNFSRYLDKNKENLQIPITINERSFEIFHREKYLDRNGGKEFISKLGFTKERLNFYETSEPMSYYSHTKNMPQKFLIIENKDTFYSMRKHLTHSEQEYNHILGLETGTLIYGCGKGIYKTFEDYVTGVEPYFQHRENEVYYFGDLDYEGILIYETLCERYPVKINLFTEAYLRMIKKAQDVGLENLPEMKEKQSKNIGSKFMEQFNVATREFMVKMLKSGYYIPQEILNEMDYGVE